MHGSYEVSNELGGKGAQHLHQFVSYGLGLMSHVKKKLSPKKILSWDKIFSECMC